MRMRKWDVAYHLKFTDCIRVLNFLPEILSEVSEQQSERFHQGINSTEYCCPGFWKGFMKADVP
jgi:hypothetical protein